jgi:hypothetical protein
MTKRLRRSPALALASFVATFGVAQATPLKVVNVGAPAVNCVFSIDCKNLVTDSLATVPVPGVSGTAPWPGYGPAVLQSRTHSGNKGAPAAGETAYVYRMVMSYAVGSACVSALKLDVGPIKRHYYNLSGMLADIYVVTTGGLGTIGVSSAEQDGTIVTFTFKKPICAGPAAEKGEQSFFFGYSATGQPKPTSGKVQVVGGPMIETPARAPQH